MNDQEAPVTDPITREALAARHGKVWSEEELSQEFAVTAIIGMSVVARRKVDGVVGTLEFTNEPRFYFNWRTLP
jgi:hypothetical protein